MENKLFGNGMNRMPDFAFRIMKIFFKVYYFFRPADLYLKKFGIKPGSTVIDYGCGPGSCLSAASKLVGEKGTVIAADIHEMAIASVEKLIKQKHLINVKSVLTDTTNSPISNDTADLIYALDMFHMVKDTDPFLKELCRITKKDGILIIEDGHQPRSLSKEKILASAAWKIIGEEKRFLKCVPVKQVV
jgi:ubiquinone/menaquinone biosynthesis C-methylase UbiE